MKLSCYCLKLSTNFQKVVVEKEKGNASKKYIVLTVGRGTERSFQVLC